MFGIWFGIVLQTRNGVDARNIGIGLVWSLILLVVSVRQVLFARLTKRRVKRGVFRSIVELQAAIGRFLTEHNSQPHPFKWTADPDKIIAAIRRGHQAVESIH